MNGALFGNRVFADEISYEGVTLEWGGPNTTTSVLIRGIFGRRRTGRGQVTMEAETRVLRPQAQGHGSPPRLEEAGRTLSWGLGRERGLPIPSSWTFSPSTMRVCISGFKPPPLWRFGGVVPGCSDSSPESSAPSGCRWGLAASAAHHRNCLPVLQSGEDKQTRGFSRVPSKNLFVGQSPASRSLPCPLGPSPPTSTR